MAAGTQKKGSKKGFDDSLDPVQEISTQLISRIEEDRERISEFLNKLLNALDQAEDPFSFIGSADSVAKISDALTRQGQLTVEAMKVLVRKSPVKRDPDEVFKEIGLAFGEGEEKPEGQN